MARTLLGDAADVPRGGSRTFVKDGKKIIVADTPGGYAAYENFCPHMGGALRGDGRTFTCGWHGATFDAATGDAVSGIADGSRLKRVDVVEEGGKLYWERAEERSMWDDFG